MKRRGFLCESLALMAVAGCSNSSEAMDSARVGLDSQPGGQADESDLNAMRQVGADILEAHNGLDLDALMSHMHPDVTYLVPSAAPIRGWETVRTMYGERFDRLSGSGQYVHLAAVTHEIVVAGEWAWKFGESHVSIAPLGETPTIAADSSPGSKHVGVYKKEDGRWLRYVQIRNGNTPEMNI